MRKENAVILRNSQHPKGTDLGPAKAHRRGDGCPVCVVRPGGFLHNVPNRGIVRDKGGHTNHTVLPARG